MKIRPALASWLQVGPLAAVLILFFGIPVLVVIAVSFFDFSRGDIIPTFILDNYQEIFTSDITLRLYLNSLKYAVIVWAITLVVGFTLAPPRRLEWVVTVISCLASLGYPARCVSWFG